MNNTILIKGADFSNNKIGKLNIQKLTINDSDIQSGAQKAVQGVLTTIDDIPERHWYPSVEMAHAQISIPSNTKYLFGKITTTPRTDVLNTFLSTSSQNNLYIDGVAPWIYYDTITSKWIGVATLMNVPSTRFQILGRKDNLYYDNNFSCLLTDGAIYGVPFLDTINPTSIVVNWVPNTSPSAPELGIVKPELYVVFA